MIPFGAEFEFLQARIMFGANKLEVPWMVGEPMPPDLPEKIIDAIQPNPAAMTGQAAAPTARGATSSGDDERSEASL